MHQLALIIGCQHRRELLQYFHYEVQQETLSHLLVRKYNLLQQHWETILSMKFFMRHGKHGSLTPVQNL